MELQPQSGSALIAATISAVYAVVALPVFYASQAVSWEAALIVCFLATTLIALSTIDARTFEIPDNLTLPLLVAGVLLRAPHGAAEVLAALGAAAAAFGAIAGIATIYAATRGRDGIGLGDAKLLAAAGAWLGLLALPTVVGLASLAALATVGAVAFRVGRPALDARLPFGPFLALAFWVVWLYGPIALMEG